MNTGQEITLTLPQISNDECAHADRVIEATHEVWSSRWKAPYYGFWAATIFLFCTMGPKFLEAMRSPDQTVRMNPAWAGMVIFGTFAILFIATAIAWRLCTAQRQKAVAALQTLACDARTESMIRKLEIISKVSWDLRAQTLAYGTLLYPPRRLKKYLREADSGIASQTDDTV